MDLFFIIVNVYCVKAGRSHNFKIFSCTVSLEYGHFTTFLCLSVFANVFILMSLSNKHILSDSSSPNCITCIICLRLGLALYYVVHNKCVSCETLSLLTEEL